MLHLTRRADYALRLMLEVASQPAGSIRTAEVAGRQEIPYQFLRKVARTLVAHGYLKSERGVGGGLALARPPETITLLDIVHVFEPSALNRCTVDPPRCDRRDCCVVYPVWARAQQEIERVLGGARLSDLVRRRRGRPLAVGAAARRA